MGIAISRTFGGGVGTLTALLVIGAPALAAKPAPTQEEIARGKEIFHREWLPGDARSHRGDGVGPVFNDTSCIACHNLGASGGAGPSSKNVDILSVVVNHRTNGARSSRLRDPKSAEVVATGIAPDPKLDELSRTHAGFRMARSVVVHRFGTDPGYDKWRLNMLRPEASVWQSQTGARSERGGRELRIAESLGRADRSRHARVRVGDFTLLLSQRNTTPLFGSGLIDAIPDQVLEEKGQESHPTFPEIHGRVSRLKGGTIGRFGWKSQMSSLKDFVLTACAVELGLDVPDHPQAGIPFTPDYMPPGLDLDARQCAALIAFVGSLPAPIMRKPDWQESRTIAAGQSLFEGVGCAACHSSRLGHVEGIYSDLLLHDMGPDLGDTGAYGVFVPDSPDQGPIDLETPLAEAQQRRGQPAPLDKSKIIGATRLEWRTPPLWGIRDSGPYLHDGRAETLEAAIAGHGGEGEKTAQRYFELSPKERLQLQAFLKSLVAPAAEVARLENPADQSLRPTPRLPDPRQ